MKSPSFFGIGSLLMALAVGIGAFGAHALKATLEANGYAATFETASKYHFYHALGILLLALWHRQKPSKRLANAQWLLLFGTIIFSGTLYLLSVFAIKWLGAITPVGGVLFMIGWAMAVWEAFSSSDTEAPY